MYEIYYNIADIIIKIVSPFSFYTHNGEDFQCAPSKPDYTFYFKETDNIPKLMEKSSMAADLIWAHEYMRADHSYFRAFIWKENFYPAISELHETEGICFYANAGILAERAKEGFELLMYLCLEQILLKFHCLVLHSSHVNIQGQGLLFSAPSQTGKSTQAELWRTYADAKVMNGDRTVLRKTDGQWYAYGCPMCGTSDIHLQGKEPLRHIVMLSQGKQNIIKRIHGMDAFRLLYPQITVCGWNSQLVEASMNLINDLLKDVPIWHYSCTKDKEAVYVLRNTIHL